MLVAGCESCLLAHGSFSIYCFQLVAEKLLDEEVPTAQRIDVWRFLVGLYLIGIYETNFTFYTNQILL